MSDIRGLLYREFRLYIKQPLNVLLSFVSPLLYFFFFGLSMAHSGLVTDQNYLVFFYPGYATMALFSGVSTLIQGMFNERLGGMLTEILSCPVRVGAYVVAKISFAAAIATAQTLVLMGAAYWVLPAGAAGGRAAIPLAVVVPVLLVSSVLVGSFISCIVASTTSIRTFTTVVNLVNPILMFTSSIFYPLGQLPAWMRWIAAVNPLTWCAEGLRSVMQQHFELQQGAVLLAAALVMAVAAVLLNRWRIRTL